MYQTYRAKTKLTLNWGPGPGTVRTPLDSSTVNRDAPEQAGVYILARKGTDGKYQFFYIGQANNLRRRLLEHLSISEPNACIRSRVKDPCGFKFALVANSLQRDAVEAAIYHAHPDWYPCNDRNSMPSLNPDYDVEIGF